MEQVSEDIVELLPDVDEVGREQGAILRRLPHHAADSIHLPAGQICLDLHGQHSIVRDLLLLLAPHGHCLGGNAAQLRRAATGLWFCVGDPVNILILWLWTRRCP